MSDKSLVGRTIVAVRRMTDDEREAEYWTREDIEGTYALELDDGTVLFPARDWEGNSGGALFGRDADGEGFYVRSER